MPAERVMSSQKVLPGKQASVQDEMDVVSHIHRKTCQLGQMMAKAVRGSEALGIEPFEQLADEMARSALRNRNALIFGSRAYSEVGYTHSMGTAALMILMAQRLGMSDPTVCEAGAAGLLHDVGNFQISTRLLNKPTALSAEEFKEVSKHPVYGDKALERVSGATPEVRDAVRHHHERIDGTGYPDGISDAEIPPLTRMLAIADVYDALANDRAYHKALAYPKAIELMHQMAPGKFDLKMLASLTQCLGLYPSGSLVRLYSDRLAVVVESRDEHPKYPLVSVFFDIDGFSKIPAEMVDLAKAQDDGIVAVEEPSAWDVDLGAELRRIATYH